MPYVNTPTSFEVRTETEDVETVQAAYFQVSQRWVEFKDAANKVVFALPEHRVLSIRKADPNARTVTVTLKADTSGYAKAVREATVALRKFNDERLKIVDGKGNPKPKDHA